MKKILLGLVPLIGTACQTQKPNVLILFADDQRADALGCSGNEYIRTPNIDSLAMNGTRFTNSYIMGGHHGAISAPSRAMLMSGKYLFNVYDKLEGVRTMPMHFADNGYITFGTGKWHNGGNTFEASFQNGKSVFLGGMNNHYSVTCRDLDSERKLSAPEQRGFSTDVFADAAIEFIDGYAGSDRIKPFFCYVAFTVPHDPYSPAPEYIDNYRGNSLPLPGNWLPLHPFQFDDLTVRDENLLPWPRPPDKVKEVLADYYGLITHLDTRIGDIINELRKNDLLDNTIIIYAADNGLAIGSHGLLGKQNLYEHSMKVPLIISGPGVKKGKTTGAFVYLLDLFPTLTDLCRLQPPENIDGKSLAGLLGGKEEGIRNSVFTAYRNTVRAVRKDEWKMIRYPERHFTQLFNLESDPLELNNLAGDGEYQEKLNELTGLMQSWQKETNDTARLTSGKQLPMEYDHTLLKRKADQWQPEYTLLKYFSN